MGVFLIPHYVWTGETMYTLRTFEQRDYPDLVHIHNALFPDMPRTLKEVQDEDRRRSERADHHRWVVEADGHVVASAQREHDLWDYDPHTYMFDILVDPDHQRRGIGTLLYDTVIASVKDATKLCVWFKSSFEESVRFLEHRGFFEAMRIAESCIDLNEWDESVRHAHERAVTERGICIRSYAELADDPQRDQKLYDLDRAAGRDVPGVTSEPTYEEWKKIVIENPYFPHDCYLVAVDGDSYVGLTNLIKVGGGTYMVIGLTAVRREYRGMGIAKALKTNAMWRAKERGFSRLETANEVNNTSILSLNMSLGFTRKPDWLRFDKIMK
jgi:GNAT superfamily N-acetyltransferase